MIAFTYGKKNEGSTLILAMIFSAILFITSASYLLMISSEYSLNNRSYRGNIAINLAEAGVDYAINALDTGDIDTWGGTNPKTKTIYSFQTASGKIIGDFQVQVTDPSSSNPIIESTGHVPGITDSGKTDRTVKVRLAPASTQPFTEAFFGDDYVKIIGGGYVDSYDSDEGSYGGDNVGSNGDVLTNGSTEGAIELDGGAAVNGDAGTGEGGTVSGEDKVTGSITHDVAKAMPPVEVPSALTGLGYWDGFGLLSLTGSSTHTLDSGDYKFKRIKLTASAKLTINGPARVYITGYLGKSILQAGGDCEIICNGKVTFYVDDHVQVAGTGVTNSGQMPSDLIIYGTDTAAAIDLSGGASFYGAIYAPEAQVNLGGNSDGYGAFIGKEVIAGGTTGYHYDAALQELEVSSSGYSVAYWQEK